MDCSYFGCTIPTFIKNSYIFSPFLSTKLRNQKKTEEETLEEERGDSISAQFLIFWKSQYLESKVKLFSFVADKHNRSINVIFVSLIESWTRHNHQNACQNNQEPPQNESPAQTIPSLLRDLHLLTDVAKCLKIHEASY